jgi:hypothetical protein
VFSTNVVEVFTNANDGVTLNVGAVRSGVTDIFAVKKPLITDVAVMFTDE